MQRPATLFPILIVAVGAVSTAAVLIKLSHDAAASIIAAARLGIATCLLVPWTIAFKKRIRIPKHHAGMIILSGLFLAAHFYFWITSLKTASVLSSVVIVTTNPIFVAIGSAVFFQERLGHTLLAAIAIAIVGGVMIAISDSDGSGSLHGNFLALCGALASSCYFLVGRRVRMDVDIWSYIVPVYGVAAFALVLIAALSGHTPLGFRSSTYLYLVLLAIGPQLIGHGSLNWALRYVTATTVAVFVLGEPIGAALIAWFVLDEPVRPLQLCGASLILLGIFLTTRTTSDGKPT